MKRMRNQTFNFADAGLPYESFFRDWILGLPYMTSKKNFTFVAPVPLVDFATESTSSKFVGRLPGHFLTNWTLITKVTGYSE